jgi:predicted transposase/invertase (TIGR01784 family)
MQLHKELVLPVLRRFYLDELGKNPNQSLSVGIMRLVVEKKRKKQTGELARQLMNKANSEITTAALQEKVLQFIQTVVIDKFPELTVEELEVMLDLESLRKSKVYLEGKQEGRLEQKIEMIPILKELGLTTEQIAQRLNLNVETVQENLKK